MTSLDQDALRAALSGWARVHVVAETGSTNADLVAAVAGSPDCTVLVAEHQHAGRGRLARSWSSPPGSGLTFSVLLRPSGVPQDRFGWLPLLAGLALADVVRGLTDAPCGLKWPNDLLLGDGQRKAAGILAEVADPVAPAIVVGFGINVAEAPLDEPGATCLAEYAEVDRAGVLVEVLRRFAEREHAWRARAGDPETARADYRAACLTLGSPVRVTMPGTGYVDGIAEDVDVDGRLLVLEPGGRRRAMAAGDVTHVRPVP